MSAPHTAPIADLSYRNYEGRLESPRLRWWVIAKMTMRQAFKKKMMWVAMAFSAWYYLGMIFVLFVVDQVGQAARENNPNAPNPMEQFLGRIVWKDQFLHGFSYGQLLFLVMALVLGAGAIANDNRANALLMYLSKPVSKLDYLFGKWFGIFLPLLVVMAMPSALFYMYGALSYRSDGFLYQDPWVFLKLPVVLVLGAAFFASLMIGFSSMFSQGRLAGATIAGLYFLSNFFTKLMTGAWIAMSERDGPFEHASDATHTMISRLFYASIDGLNIGMAKAVLATDGTPYFGIPSRLPMVPRPPLLPVLGIMVAISAICLLIAWRKIRAVEVVK